MTRPKGKLIALIAIFAAIGLVTASGAFTSVNAQRTVAINVSDDANALLQLEPNGTSSNGQAYATTENGRIVIDLSGENGGQITSEGAQGINDNATTIINHTVNVTNQGTQNIDLSASVSNTNSNVDVYLLANNRNKNLSSNSITNLGTGSQVSLGLKIVTDGAGSSTNFNATITLQADATNPG